MFFFSGREEDKETVIAVRKLLELVSSFPDHFDETTMFNGGQHAKVRFLFSRRCACRGVKLTTLQEVLFQILTYRYLDKK
jgi:hypothetical protein